MRIEAKSHPRTICERGRLSGWAGTRLAGILLFCGLTVLATSATAVGQPTAFVGVHLVDAENGRVIRSQSVLIENDRITAVGPADSITIPDGARRIDGSGQYLVPGLAEMHGHIPPPSADRQLIEDTLFLYVSNGITTVRGMLGWPGQLALREEVNAGRLIAPTLYLAGPSFNGNSINSVEEAVTKVREQHAAGWDLLKIHPGLTRAEYDAMADTAAEVGIRFGGHIPADVGLLHALNRRQETIDHLDGYLEYLTRNGNDISPGEMAEVVEKTRQAGTWVVPTMALWDTILGAADLERLMAYPELKYVPTEQVANWEQATRRRIENPPVDPAQLKTITTGRRRLLKALADAGVGILMGTDAPQLFSVPGFSLRHELKVMADSGMSPAQILQSGTTNVGRYFAAKDSFGAIQKGHRADLLLLRGDPLQNIENVFDQSGVMIRGRWLPTSEISQQLEEIARRYSR